MSVSQSQIKATSKYNKNNYDNISIRVPKGKKEIYKQYAEKENCSMAKYIDNAIAFYEQNKVSN